MNQYAVLYEIVKLLPADGHWTARERDDWLALIRAASDYLVRIEEPAQALPPTGGETS